MRRGLRAIQVGYLLQGIPQHRRNPAPLGFLLDPANHAHKEAQWDERVRRYIEIEWQGHRIWGVTAAIIANLSRRLAWEAAAHG